jgi:hypothetical protein
MKTKMNMHHFECVVDLRLNVAGVNRDDAQQKLHSRLQQMVDSILGERDEGVFVIKEPPESHRAAIMAK